MLQVLDTPACSAEENMRIDETLFESLDHPILHFYNWRSFSITYGYFIDPKKFLDLAKVKELGMDIARRPTGGGIVFHKWDLAFSFLLPAASSHFFDDTLSNYRFVNSLVIEVINKFLNGKKGYFFDSRPAPSKFCMATPSFYDILVEGKKVVGASERRSKRGYLHQSTISLKKPLFEELDLVVADKVLLEEIIALSFPVEADPSRVKACLKEVFLDRIRL